MGLHFEVSLGMASSPKLLSRSRILQKTYELGFLLSILCSSASLISSSSPNRPIERKEEIKEMSDQLPQDLQIHILVRLPVKSLLRFQCVSKSWKSLIRSTAFISTHTNHNQSTNNYAHLVKGNFYRPDNDEEEDMGCKLLQFDDSFREFQKFEFPSQITNYEFFQEVLDCRGLLLLTNPHNFEGDRFEPIILWNPAVRMSMTLPRPCIDIFGSNYVHGFGFDHKSNDYKVLRMVYGYKLNGALPGTIFPRRAELFKLRTGTWKTISVMDDFHYFIPRVARPSQAFVNGAAHWVGDHSRFHGYYTDIELVILLFHMSDEEFRLMKLPDVLTTVNHYSISVIVSGGLLSLIHRNTGDGNMCLLYVSCCIWLMKDYGVIESWTKQCTIDLRDFGGLKRIFSFRNNRVQLLIETQREELVLYDHNTNRFIHLGIGNRDYYLSMNTYTKSLILLNQVNAVPEYETSSRKRMQPTKG